MKQIQYFILSILTFVCFSGSAQLSATDSIFFQSIFTHQRYVDDNIMPGNWYHFPPMGSVQQHLLTIDTQFVFARQDLDSISGLTVADTIHYDTLVNNSMALYPNNYPQQNQMVLLPYNFKNHSALAYGFLFPDTLQPSCRYAFLMVPGTGENMSYAIVNGWGYHNTLCQMVANCRKFGDVYTFIKPNEESRAIQWNGHKLNEYIVNYLITQNRRYGINYLIEMIAWVKYLKKNYDKVFLFGLSEGGYASLLCTLFEQPDAALISGGYSILFDSTYAEKDILRTRFDSLVDYYDRAYVKNKIQNSSTHYLFTYGDNDPVLTMDPEHDFHFTQNYFNGAGQCSFFYDFQDHTFPPCTTIDTFVQRITSSPLAKFYVTDTILNDSLKASVAFCRPGNYSFELFLNNQWVLNFSNITDTLQLHLVDSGMYSIRNVMDSSQWKGQCHDSIWFNKMPVVIPNHLNETIEYKVQFNNPFQQELMLDLPFPAEVMVMDLYGKPIWHQTLGKGLRKIPTAEWPGSIYFLLLDEGNGKRHRFKLLHR
jgi:hypothetical protein